MATETELIRKIDFFEPLDPKIINKIADVCIAREYAAGDYIVKQGESGLGLFFITSGRVKVEIERNGTKSVVAQLNAEDFLGELSIIDNKPRSANVICLEDTRCLLLTRDSFTKLMNKYPEIAVQMAKSLAGRIRATNDRMGQPFSQVAASAESAATSSSAATTAAPVAPVTSGTAPPAPAQDSSTKGKIRDSLVSAFSMLYTMKALTRFSVALVGCPVQLSAEGPGSPVIHDSVDDVKVAVFPASRSQVLEIRAWADGAFSATVLQPNPSGSFAASRFDGAIRNEQRLNLYVPAVPAR